MSCALVRAVVEPVFFKTLPNPEAEGGSENFAV